MIRDQFDEVAAAYQLATERGDPGALAQLCARYPQYEEQLLRFALRDAAVPTATPVGEEAFYRAMITPAMQQRALASILEDRAFALSGILARAAVVGLDPRALAATVDLPRDMLLLLDNRVLVAVSVPRTCLRRLAEALQTSVGALRRFLESTGNREVPPPASPCAETAPAATAQQSFAEALAHSTLASPTQRAFWRSVLEEEQTAG